MTRPGQVPVVVTGLGATTPLGGDVASTWSAMLAGKSGVRSYDELDTMMGKEWIDDDMPVRIFAPAAVDPTEVLDRVEARKLDRCSQLALIAGREAWHDAGSPQIDGERIGVVLATGIGGMSTLIQQYDVLREKGSRRISPRAVPMLMGNASAAWLGMEIGALAGVHTPVSACASGAEAVAYGLDMIRSGRADIVLCGGTETAYHAMAAAGFAAMRALSKRNDEPDRASRPLDKNRDGFVMGEGAGALVLESAESAARRGARVHGELAGASVTSDAFDIAIPEPEGRGSARAMRLALTDGGLTPQDVVHINAHATATSVGDLAEAKAIRSVFEDATDSIAVSATKSMTGHLFGAAGAVEAIATVLALRTRMAPPTINCDDQDDEILLNVVRFDPRTLPGGDIAALSNSFGFGGHNVSLAFRRTQ